MSRPTRLSFGSTTRPTIAVKARVNRRGTRIVCGRGDCGTTLVQLEVVPRDRLLAGWAAAQDCSPETTGQDPGRYPIRWTPATGLVSERIPGDPGPDVYRPTSHARGSFARDRRLASGGASERHIAEHGAGIPADDAQRARERLRSGRNRTTARPRDMTDHRTYDYQHEETYSLPGKIICIGCGALNDLGGYHKSLDLLREAYRNQERSAAFTGEERAAALSWHRTWRHRSDQLAAARRADFAAGRYPPENYPWGVWGEERSERAARHRFFVCLQEELAALHDELTSEHEAAGEKIAETA